MASNDVETLKGLLAEDLHHVHANGVVEDKAEFLSKLRSRERIYRRFEAISATRAKKGISRSSSGKPLSKWTAQPGI